jgi:hypothetical protein
VVKNSASSLQVAVLRKYPAVQEIPPVFPFIGPLISSIILFKDVAVLEQSSPSLTMRKSLPLSDVQITVPGFDAKLHTPITSFNRSA